MGLFDSMKRQAESEAKKAVQGAVRGAVNGKQAVTFTFQRIPQDLNEFASLPEAEIKTPFQTAALSCLALLRYETDPEAAFEMLNALKGPQPLSPYDRSFINDRLKGKTYKPFSYFAGATPANGYQPSVPYQITITSGPYSYPQENYATLYLTSSGADSPRTVKLRKKPSTGEWFLLEVQYLSDIRLPVAEDPWA